MRCSRILPAKIDPNTKQPSDVGGCFLYTYIYELNYYPPTALTPTIRVSFFGITLCNRLCGFVESGKKTLAGDVQEA